MKPIALFQIKTHFKMAAGWGVTTNSQSIEYTYNWAIENFDFNMGHMAKLNLASLLSLE